jgi:hypothetical protein
MIMAFSKEDKSAWESSEVMRELEKYAEEVLNGPPPEAFQPIKTAKDPGKNLWEEEAWEEEMQEKEMHEKEMHEGVEFEGIERGETPEALEWERKWRRDTGEAEEEAKRDQELWGEEYGPEIFGDIKKEMSLAYRDMIVKNLESLASDLGERSKIKAAYIVEQAIYRIKGMFREDK